MYKVFRNSLGKVDAINREFDGASIPFDQLTRFNEEHPLVIELREWEAENEPLDLSDIAVTEPIQSENVDETLTFPGTYTQRFTGLLPALNSDNTKWQVGVGEGQIVDAYTDSRSPVVRIVSNTATQLYDKPSLLNGLQTSVYAYYYWDGSAIAVDYQAIAPVADDLPDKLFVCAILSVNGITIDAVRPISLADEPETKNLLNRGAINLDNAYPQPINNSLRLSFPGGSFKFAGRNAYQDPKRPHTVCLQATAEITYTLCDPNGNILATETDFNFNRFWNNGALTPLSQSTNAAAQFVYMYPSGVFVVVVGEYEYQVGNDPSASLSLAADQWQIWENRLPPPNLRNNSILLCAIVAVGNATNLADNNQAMIAFNL